MDILTADDVKTRMGLPAAIDEADDAIDSALASARSFVHSKLETILEYNIGLSDTFLLTDGTFPIVPDGYFRLRLEQAFVETGTVIVSGGDVMTDVTVIAATEYKVDLVKGIVFIPETYVGQFITVGYNAGIEASDDAPDWLREAILAYVPGVLNTMQISNRDDEYTATLKSSDDMAMGILAPNMRGRAYQYRAMF